MACKLDTQIRREQIIQAALALIREKGLRNLRIPDIAREVGLVSSALYRHFSSKQELVLAIVSRVRATLENHLIRSGRVSSDPLSRLDFLMDEHLGMMRKSPAMPLLVLSEDAAFGDPKMRRRILEIHKFFREAVAGIIEEAKSSGRVSPSTDSRSAALVFVSLIQHTAILMAISCGDVDLGSLAKETWKNYIEKFEG